MASLILLSSSGSAHPEIFILYYEDVDGEEHNYCVSARPHPSPSASARFERNRATRSRRRQSYEPEPNREKSNEEPTATELRAEPDQDTRNVT